MKQEKGAEEELPKNIWEDPYPALQKLYPTLKKKKPVDPDSQLRQPEYSIMPVLGLILEIRIQPPEKTGSGSNLQKTNSKNPPEKMPEKLHACVVGGSATLTRRTTSGADTCPTSGARPVY